MLPLNVFIYLASGFHSDNCTVSIKISPHSHLFVHNWHDMWFLHFRQKCHLILSQQSRWKSGFVSYSGTFYTFYSTSIVLWHDSAAGCNTAVASDFIVAGLSSLFCQRTALLVVEEEEGNEGWRSGAVRLLLRAAVWPLVKSGRAL